VAWDQAIPHCQAVLRRRAPAVRQMKRFVSRGILTLSLVVVLLAATASTASADTTLNPTSADYGNRQVGTTSPAQAFTLRTFCGGSQSACLIFGTSFSPIIGVSGDFSQTNDCPRRR